MWTVKELIRAHVCVCKGGPEKCTHCTRRIRRARYAHYTHRQADAVLYKS